MWLLTETVILTFVYCIVLRSFVLFVFFLSSFISDCCMTEFVDLRNDMRVYACMYV